MPNPEALSPAFNDDAIGSSTPYPYTYVYFENESDHRDRVDRQTIAIFHRFQHVFVILLLGCIGILKRRRHQQDHIVTVPITSSPAAIVVPRHVTSQGASHPNPEMNTPGTTGLSIQVIQDKLQVDDYCSDDAKKTTSSSYPGVPNSYQHALGDVAQKTSHELCAICFDPLSKQPICHSNNVACRHMFHKDCMVSRLLLKNECPTCRQKHFIVGQESA